MENQEEKIIDTLQSLKGIKPDTGFTELSRRLILSERQEVTRVVGKKQWSIFGAQISKTVVLAGLAVLIVVGGGILLNQRHSNALAKTNKQKLLSEAQSLNFDIKVKEVQYFNQSAENVTVALNEAFDKGKEH